MGTYGLLLLFSTSDDQRDVSSPVAMDTAESNTRASAYGKIKLL